LCPYYFVWKHGRNPTYLSDDSIAAFDEQLPALSPEMGEVDILPMNGKSGLKISRSYSVPATRD
jgi:hypothetical protein